MELQAVAAVGGHRLTWAELPEHVQQRLTSMIGAPVVASSSHEGGFSPALASVLTLADGRTVFAKSINATRNAFSTDGIRREASILAALPTAVPAPRLLAFDDDGEWVALVTEAVDGHNPAQPWERSELTRFLDATTVLAESLTPTPIDIARRFVDMADEFTQWSRLDPARLDAGVRDHLDELITMESGWIEATAGESLLHGDLRSDNFLLTADGFSVVDWPSVVIGAPWLDLLYAFPSIAMHGGGDVDELWRKHPLSIGVDDEAANAALAGAAGFFIGRSLEPPVPLLPTIRAFQRAQGLATLHWLGQRLNWR